jgi:hypothetical protein
VLLRLPAAPHRPLVHWRSDAAAFLLPPPPLTTTYLFPP